EGALERLVPELEGSFWLPNLYGASQRLAAVEPAPCPSCARPAHRRTMRDDLGDRTRVVVVCPRCGIGYDVPDGSAVRAVTIDAPELTPAGGSMRLSV